MGSVAVTDPILVESGDVSFGRYQVHLSLVLGDGVTILQIIVENMKENSFSYFLLRKILSPL